MASRLPNTVLNPQLPKRCRVKVIGLGGVGGIVARYGAVFLAAQNKDVSLILIDGDGFEPSNSSRMIFGDYGNKAMVVRSELVPRFRNTRLMLTAVPSFITRRNKKRLIQEGDIVILCVDNHATRKLVSDHCAKLKNICLISGGNDGVGPDSSGAIRRGTYGNVQIMVRQRGKDISPSLTQYHPEIQHPKDKPPNAMSCTELVLSTPQILFANLAVASVMLNTLLLYLSNSMHYGEISFDIADGLMRPTIGVIKYDSLEFDNLLSLLSQ